MRAEARELYDVLARVALRLGAGIALRLVVRIAAGASLLALIWALATAIVPVPPPPRAGAGLVVALLLGFPILLWLCRPSRLAAARVADRRLSLADRLSTAVELLAEPGVPQGLARSQILDAIKAAWGLDPRAAAPVRIPREMWTVVVTCGALFLWAHFLLGWSIPGLPASRNAGVIHHEGQALVALGRQLESQGVAEGLPQTRRAAGLLEDLGRRLQDPRVSRRDALGLLGAVGRQLKSAEDAVARRLGGTPLRGSAGGAGSQEVRTGISLADAERLQGALRELESITEQLRGEGTPETRAHLALRLRTLAESLDRMRVPASSGRSIATARREVERGHLSVAASALGDAMQDLQGIERMLGDAQGLRDAGRQVQHSAERIAGGPSLGSGLRLTDQAASSPGPPQPFPGPNPPGPGAAGAPPPPGPNQGSLPGQGHGPALGLPTPRLGGHRVEERLSGTPGEGPAITRDLLAPGRAGPPGLPVVRPPADVAHANDRALAREELPPAYVTMIRRYFEALGEPR